MRALVRRLLLLAVLVAAGWFVARWYVGSAWAKQSAERRLGRALEMSAGLRAMRLEWPGYLVMEDVSASLSDAPGSVAELTVKELRVSLCGRRTEWRRPQVVLVRGPAGDWQPSFLRGLAAGMDDAKPLEAVLDSVGRSLAGLRVCDVKNATVLFRSDDGTEKPVFGGLSWRVRPVRLEGHGSVTHHRATLQTRNGVAVGADGWMEVEWLSSPGEMPTRLSASIAESGEGDRTDTSAEPAVAPSVEVVSPAVPGAADEAAPAADNAGDPGGESRPEPKGVF